MRPSQYITALPSLIIRWRKRYPPHVVLNYLYYENGSQSSGFKTRTAGTESESRTESECSTADPKTEKNTASAIRRRSSEVPKKLIQSGNNDRESSFYVLFLYVLFSLIFTQKGDDSVFGYTQLLLKSLFTTMNKYVFSTFSDFVFCFCVGFFLRLFLFFCGCERVVNIMPSC